MTTTVKIHVNGRYRATVVQTNADGEKKPPVIVDGNYAGSPNPSGEYSFHLYHPAIASFDVTEEPAIASFDVTEEPVPEEPAAKPAE